MSGDKIEAWFGEYALMHDYTWVTTKKYAQRFAAYCLEKQREEIVEMIEDLPMCGSHYEIINVIHELTQKIKGDDV